MSESSIAHISKLILVVDDEKDIAENVSDILTMNENRKVIRAHSPAEAYMRTVNQKYDLIISDFRMPKTDGMDLIRSVRAQKHNAHIPVIIISGYPDEVYKKLGNLQDVYVIPKPFMAEDLIKISEEMMSLPPREPVKKAQLDVKIINHFAQASIFTVRTLAGVQDIQADKPYLMSREKRLGVDISGILTMKTNKFNGVLGICFPEKTYLALLNAMLKEEYTEITSDIDGNAAEIINLIYSQAKTNMASEGYEFEATIPHVLSGKDHRIAAMDAYPTIVLPFNAKIGTFYVLCAAI